MTDKEFIAALEEKLELDRHAAAETNLRDLAFVIHRFCGGKIEYTVEEISSLWHEIDIQRAYRDGKITYTTRPRQGAAEDPEA